MIAKEGLPALRRWPPSLGHVFCDRGLADIDAKLEQFAVNPWRSPQRVGNAHLENELANGPRASLAGRRAVVISSANTLENRRDANGRPSPGWRIFSASSTLGDKR